MTCDFTDSNVRQLCSFYPHRPPIGRLARSRISVWFCSLRPRLAKYAKEKPVQVGIVAKAEKPKTEGKPEEACFLASSSETLRRTENTIKKQYLCIT
jgi:hypothetical protein